MYYNYYIFYFVILLLFLIICNNISTFKSKYKYIVSIFSIFFIGQRWGSGVDFYGYLSYYINNVKTERGYYFIQTIFRENNLYFGLIIFIFYIITLVISLKIFTKFCDNNLSIFIFFISEYHIMSINPIRTYLSLIFFIILCNLYIFRQKKRKIKTIFFFILGFCFHKGIIFTIPSIFFIKKIPYKKIFLIALLVLPLLDIRSLIEYTPYAENYLGSVYDVKSSLLNHIKYYLTVVLYFYFKSQNQNQEIENLFLMYLILYGLSMNLGPIHRIAYYFKIYELIYLCQILNKKNRSMKILFDKFIVVMFFILMYFGASYKDLGYMFIYKFRWLKIKNEVTFEEYQNEIIEYLNILENRGK